MADGGAVGWSLRRLAVAVAGGGGGRIVPKMNFCFGHEYPCPLDLCCTQPQGGREIDPLPPAHAQTFVKSNPGKAEERLLVKVVEVRITLHYAWTAPAPAPAC